MIDAATPQLLRPLMLGDAAIDHYSYYEAGDVLYLTVGAPQRAADDDDSVEGHVVFFDANGRVIGVTIIGAREQLDRDGALSITLHDDGPAAQFPRDVVEPLLVETLGY